MLDDIYQDARESMGKTITSLENELKRVRTGRANLSLLDGIRVDYYGTLTPINQNRREKELPDLIQCAIDDGLRVKSFDIGEGYVNINTPEDIAIAEKENAQRFFDSSALHEA